MRAAIISAMIAVVWSGAAAAKPVSAIPAAQIDATFSAFNRTTPGCAVGVEKDGKPLFAKGYGMADLEHGVPITPKTAFYMASVSKQFTALSLLTLAKQQKLALTDSVRKYVPELPAYADKITIYELLTHTSGIRDYFSLGALAGLPSETPYNDDQVLRMLARQQGTNFEPGSAFLYSNSGYVLLSIIAKRVSGEPLNDVARADLFEPLGMTSTRFQHDHSALIPDKAFGYELRHDAWHASNSMLDVVGDGGLYSTLDDMFRWMANFDAPKVGADELAQMEAPGKLADGKAIDYGMGLEPSMYRGLKVIDHSGALAGYRTEDMWFPSERLAVVVLCNDGAASPTLLARKVADLYLTTAPQPPAAPAPESIDRPEVKIDASRLDAFAGDYEVRPGMILSFMRDKDHLVTNALGGDPQTLHAVSDSAFRLKALSAEVDFDAPAADGKSQGASFHINGATLPMKRVTIAKPSVEQLAAYQGRYHSDELDVTYEVSVRNGALTVRYPGGDFDLKPVGPDTFGGGQVGQVKFACSAPGAPCEALVIEDSRALGLRFTRVKSGG